MSEAVRKRLIQVARRGETITYQPIADVLGMDMDLQSDRALLGRLLGEISTHEHQHGRPLLSAVVVLAATNMPGAGFFDLARSLKLHSPRDDLTFFARHLRLVHDHWRGTQA